MKNKEIKDQKYIMEFDPIGWTGQGQWLIKVDNAAKTPFAAVNVGMPAASKTSADAREFARIKADRIVKSLNILKGLEL